MTTLTNENVARKARNIIDHQFQYVHEEVLVLCNRYLSAIDKIEHLQSKLESSEAQLAELRGQEPFAHFIQVELDDDGTEREWSECSKGASGAVAAFRNPVPPAASQPYTVPDEALRANFEAYAGKNGLNIERGSIDGTYASLPTYDAWNAVLACRAAMLQNHIPDATKMVPDNAAPQHKG